MDYVLLVKYGMQEGAMLYKNKITNYRIGINESFQCAKITPEKMHNLRQKIFEQKPDDLSIIHKFSKEIYVNDIIKNEKNWNVEIEKPEYFFQIKRSMKYRVFVFWLKIYMLICV